MVTLTLTVQHNCQNSSHTAYKYIDGWHLFEKRLNIIKYCYWLFQKNNRFHSECENDRTMADNKSSRRRKYSTSSNSSVDSAEEQRRRDLKERDEFADRLRKKDKSHTRKVTEVSKLK